MRAPSNNHFNEPHNEVNNSDSNEESAKQNLTRNGSRTVGCCPGHWKRKSKYNVYSSNRKTLQKVTTGRKL